MSVIQITDLNDPQLDIYARLSEGQLLHYYEPDLGFLLRKAQRLYRQPLSKDMNRFLFS